MGVCHQSTNIYSEWVESEVLNLASRSDNNPKQWNEATIRIQSNGVKDTQLLFSLGVFLSSCPYDSCIVLATARYFVSSCSFRSVVRGGHFRVGWREAEGMKGRSRRIGRPHEHIKRETNASVPRCSRGLLLSGARVGPVHSTGYWAGPRSFDPPPCWAHRVMSSPPQGLPPGG